MATAQQLAAIAAALSVYLEQDVQVPPPTPVSGWGTAARREAVELGTGIMARDDLPAWPR